MGTRLCSVPRVRLSRRAGLRATRWFLLSANAALGFLMRGASSLATIPFMLGFFVKSRTPSELGRKMVDEVARALCDAAGRSIYPEPERVSDVCSHCEKLPDGRRKCIYWESFRGEAKAAIIAAHDWHKKERRWPAFVSR